MLEEGRRPVVQARDGRAWMRVTEEKYGNIIAIQIHFVGKQELPVDKREKRRLAGE